VITPMATLRLTSRAMGCASAAAAVRLAGAMATATVRSASERR
jgi:hypothetical protein